MERSDKFVVALATAVASGVSMWWLTGPTGPLRELRAQVTVLDLDVPLEARAGSPISARTRIHNSGEVPVRECKVRWLYDPNLNTPGYDSAFSTRRPFGLKPGETQEYTFTYTPARRRSAFLLPSKAHVVCARVQSDTLARVTRIAGELTPLSPADLRRVFGALRPSESLSVRRPK